MSEQHSNDIFEANLTRLQLFEPNLAEQLREAQSAPLTFTESRSGPLTASIAHNNRPLALASKYDPDAEAEKLIDHIDFAKCAGIVALGFGLGYHVAKIARKLRRDSLLIIYEPDISLLKAALRHIDHTAWIARPDVIFAVGDMDRAQLLSRVEKFGAMLTQGTVLLTHPPSRQLHAQKLQAFGQAVSELLAYSRTQVATALVNSSRTVSNLIMNLGYYHAGQTSEALHKAAEGYPAVCVSAGPSLAKNIDLLTDPDIRKRVVIITAQTTLKPLLARGIHPDFVTALDYSEISKRFYEGLPPIPDVTLVAQPLAHPAILDNFPGPIRVTNNQFLDNVLAPDARKLTPIKSGSTVAHLSFYLAQHLGCDPIIMVGQDLGFSDGLYYCPGTAIHDVWAPELNCFNTLEMMEWQRIVRHRGNLEKLDDIHGQPIYTDEQMITYLKQFERDFLDAPQQVLDATEGGLPKSNTQAITLADALKQHAIRDIPPLPKAHGNLDIDRLDQTKTILKQWVEDITDLRQITRQTVPILKQMIEHQRKPKRMEELFKKLKPKQSRVGELQEAFKIVEELNAIGVFNRKRADRAIELDDEDQYARQKQQLQRDIENLDWLTQGCDETLTIFHDGIDRIGQLKDKYESTNRVQPVAAGGV